MEGMALDTTRQTRKGPGKRDATTARDTSPSPPGRVQVSAVLYLHRLLLRFDEPPELPLEVVLDGDLLDPVFSDAIVRWQLRILDQVSTILLRGRVQVEPAFSECSRSLVEACKGVLVAFLKPKVSPGGDDACVAYPVTTRDGCQGWVQTRHMEALSSQRGLEAILSFRSPANLERQEQATLLLAYSVAVVAEQDRVLEGASRFEAEAKERGDTH